MKSFWTTCRAVAAALLLMATAASPCNWDGGCGGCVIQDIVYIANVNGTVWHCDSEVFAYEYGEYELEHRRQRIYNGHGTRRWLNDDAPQSFSYYNGQGVSLPITVYVSMVDGYRDAFYNLYSHHGETVTWYTNGPVHTSDCNGCRQWSAVLQYRVKRNGQWLEPEWMDVERLMNVEWDPTVSMNVFKKKIDYPNPRVNDQIYIRVWVENWAETGADIGWQLDDLDLSNLDVIDSNTLIQGTGLTGNDWSPANVMMVRYDGTTTVGTKRRSEE